MRKHDKKRIWIKSKGWKPENGRLFNRTWWVSWRNTCNGLWSKNGKWVIYKTNERNGEAHIFKEYNSEDDAFEDYYELIKFYMEKEQM